MVNFMNFSMPLSVFQVLFKANLFFKDFKTVLYIQVLFKPVRTLVLIVYGLDARKLSKGFLTKRDSKQPAQLQRLASKIEILLVHVVSLDIILSNK